MKLWASDIDQNTDIFSMKEKEKSFLFVLEWSILLVLMAPNVKLFRQKKRWVGGVSVSILLKRITNESCVSIDNNLSINTA